MPAQGCVLAVCSLHVQGHAEYKGIYTGTEYKGMQNTRAYTRACRIQGHAEYKSIYTGMQITRAYTQACRIQEHIQGHAEYTGTYKGMQKGI